MAVQAQQYTASILFPSNREEQEDKGADLLLLPSFVVNGGNNHTNNSRKRLAGQMLMEDAAAAGEQFNDDPVTGGGGGGIFSLQLPPQNLPSTNVPFSGVDDQHYNSQRLPYQRLQHQPSLVSTGLHLQLPLQQQQPKRSTQQQWLEQYLPRQLMLMPPSCSVPDDLAATMRIQEDEIEQLVSAQTDHLRQTIADTTRRHLQALVAAANESTARKLREMEAELEKARRRNADLEQRAAQMTAQSAAWRDKTRAYVVAAATLQAQIRQATTMPPAVAAEGSAASDDAESACVDPRREEESRNACRRCRRRDAVVVVLPCRHLCVCRSCEPAVQVCPVCFCAKSAAVEVYVS